MCVFQFFNLLSDFSALENAGFDVAWSNQIFFDFMKWCEEDPCVTLTPDYSSYVDLPEINPNIEVPFIPNIEFYLRLFRWIV